MKIIKKLFEDINENGFSNINYGTLIKSVKLINGEMRFYESSIEGIDKFTTKIINSELIDIAFFMSGEGISLENLECNFGKYSTGYNFRDDFTLISFFDYKGYKKIKCINLELKGNGVIIKSELFSSVTFKM